MTITRNVIYQEIMNTYIHTQYTIKYDKIRMKHTFVLIVRVVVIQRNDYKFDNHMWSILRSTTHVIVKPCSHV